MKHLIREDVLAIIIGVSIFYYLYQPHKRNGESSSPNNTGIIREPPTPRPSNLDRNLVIASVLGLGTALACTLAFGAGALSSLGGTVALGQVLVGWGQSVHVH
jgi:hypothetical protein